MWWHLNRINNIKAALGEVQDVWVAKETLTPGSDVAGKFKKVAVPGSVRPEGAVHDEPTGSPVLTIVAGTVATTVHFDGVDKAPAVPDGHRAIAITTGDADLFSPGARVDLWDLSDEEPRLLVEQLIVVSVKAQRVIVGVPESSASTVVQRASSNHLRVAPSGATSTHTPKDTATPIRTSSKDATSPREHTASAGGVVPYAPSSGLSETSEQPETAGSPQREARGTHQGNERRGHAQRVPKPP